jgi:hypothetical protein
MSSDLHNYVHTRFRAAFGQPQNILGPDEHWSLRSSPSALPINVLVNGTLETPAVWVFDSHDRDDGVLKAFITRESQVDFLITQIQERVKRAAQLSGPRNA